MKSHVWIKYHHFCEDEEALILAFKPLTNTPEELGRIIKCIPYSDWCAICRRTWQKIEEATLASQKKEASKHFYHYGGHLSDKWK